MTRPRITKRTGEWRIELPGYGFHRDHAALTIGPFPSQQAALRHVGAAAPASGAQIVSAPSMREPARFDRFTTLRPTIR